jgi:hypothetical protein
MGGMGARVQKEMDGDGSEVQGRAGKKEVGGRGRVEIQGANTMTRRREAAI